MDQRTLATHVVESLRKGTPPQHGVDQYSVGNEKLIDGIKRYHLGGIEDRGIIRFMCGSWGAGKTHLFRQLREVAFEHGSIVSTVELDVNSGALNKFEKLFYSIVSHIQTPTYFTARSSSEGAPFGTVIRESLAHLATGSRSTGDEGVTYDQYSKASEVLMSNLEIDIDFKTMVQKYWETFLPEPVEPAMARQRRAEILQWFSGEDSIENYRERYGVAKMVSRENAKLMLQSLAGFVRLSGYRGLLILFDEAEQGCSVMRKSALRDAQDNLLSLINNIETLSGLFLIYATTPDFYRDPKHGVVTYGVLSGRVGTPEPRHPRALDTIWNLDAEDIALADYQKVARRIRSVYLTAYPEGEAKLPDEPTVDAKVTELFNIHPSMASIRFWRLMVTALITEFDDHLEGEPRS